MNRRVVLVVSLIILVFVPQAWAKETRAVDGVAPTADTSASIAYLPLVASQFPPEAPQLNAITNPENDGNYDISWLSARGAERYVLYESANVDFASATAIYEGLETSYSVVAHLAGTYYYRVKATNFVGDSDWSAVQSARVLPPTIFPSGADSTVLEAAPDLNTGSTIDMWVGYDHCEPARIARGLMRFELSSVPPGTPITQAQLHLYLYGSCDLRERSHTVAVHSLSADWTENLVTWSTQPLAADDAAGSTPIQSRTWGWYTIDITALVMEWIDGARPNYGLMLRGPEGSGDDSAMLAFLTRDAGAPYVPYIEITYAGGIAAATAYEAPSKSVLGSTSSIQDLIAVPADTSAPESGWLQQTSPFD